MGRAKMGRLKLYFFNMEQTTRLLHRKKTIRLYAVVVLCSFYLSGCAGLVAVSAIPGAVYGLVADQFSGEEESFAATMGSTLAATQRSLRNMQLDIDILEILDDDGFAIAFNNNKLDGKITLSKQTERLTTINVKVRATVRKDSVERVIIEIIKAELKKQPANAQLQRSKLHNLRAKANVQSKRRGWYRPGAKLNVHRTRTKGWLKVRMPSGKMAYLKGNIKSKK